MIGIDFTFISKNSADSGMFTGSLEIFTLELLDSIVAVGQEKHFAIITNIAAEKYLKRRFPTFKIYVLGGFVGKLVYLLSLKNKIGVRILKKLGCLERQLTGLGIDYIWYPWMVPEVVAGFSGKYVGTCHDLFMREANNDSSCLKMFAGSQLCVCISNFTKQQVIDTYNIPGEKIKVIPNSLSITNSEIQTQEIRELKDKEFLLDINAYQARKNTLVLLKAFERIKDAIDEDLVLCGGYSLDSYYEKCLAFINEHGLNDRVYVYFGIEEEKKNWLLKNCKLFITPSESEGFGRTPVEAGLCLKPVISTRATSLEEATCGLVRYLENPRDDEELAKLILWVLSNPDSEEKLQEIRETFARKYAPERIIKEYLKVFVDLGWIK